MRQCLSAGHNLDRSDAVRRTQERINQSRHVEDFHGARKDGESFGVFGLARTGFDQAKTQTSASTLIGKVKADRSGAYDQDVCVYCGIVHGFLHEKPVDEWRGLTDWIVLGRQEIQA